MVSRLECSVCFNDFDDFQRLPKVLDECKHTFCYQCLDDWLNRSSQDTCPMCRSPINMTVEIATNEELLAMYEKKKTMPKCNCHESRTHYCPTCFSQNYVDWDERRESGEHTFCLGCACNHFYDTEHKVKQLDADQSDMMMDFVSGDLEKADNKDEKKKGKGGTCRKVAIVAGGVAVGVISLSLAVSLCLLFKVFQI